MFWTKVWKTFVQSLKTFEMKKRPKKSAWKCPYGHLKRSFDKPADFFSLMFRSFLAQNPRTIKRWGSFQRGFYSSVRRFRRTQRKQFWQKRRNSSKQCLQFFPFSSRFSWNFFSRKKWSPECPSGHLVCMFHNLPQFFCPELQKQKSLKVTKLLKTEKSTQRRKKCYQNFL